MPVMDGGHSLRSLRNTVLSPIPVVVFSAYGRAAAQRTSNRDFAPRLAKPIRLDTLLNVIAGYC